jgi:hypothetical protein
MNNQVLVQKIVGELQRLPDNLRQEVLDFIGYLRTKYESAQATPKVDLLAEERGLLATFGTWEDDRDGDEIVEEIYASRTISTWEPDL